MSDTVLDPSTAADDTDLVAHGETEVLVARAKRAGKKRGRRPVRRSLILVHRWTSLVLGLFLVLETTSGVVLLYRGELTEATNSALFSATTSADPIGEAEAVAAVEKTDPDYVPAWTTREKGVIGVGDAEYATMYTVDPGTGKVLGFVDLDGGFLGFLVNLHDCGLGCDGYPGTIPWLAHPLPDLHLGFYDGATWGDGVLTALGLLMVLLAVSGVVIWWPGRKRISHGFRVRTGKGRFARDHDLHNVIGIVSVPFILMWGVTGAAFQVPNIENAWLTITGGHAVDDDAVYSFEPDAADASAPVLSIAEAINTAEAVAGHDDVRYLTLPAEGAEYYTVSINGRLGSYAHRPVFGGDMFVYVDAHDASHTKLVSSKDAAVANAFYDQVFEPSHFGWNVDGWWRIVWVAMGLTPLALMLTGISTWLFRRGTKRRRRQRLAARAAAADAPAAT